VAKETFRSYARISGFARRIRWGRDDRPFAVSAPNCGETGQKRERALVGTGARSKLAEDNPRCDKASLSSTQNSLFSADLQGFPAGSGMYALVLGRQPASGRPSAAFQRQIPYSQKQGKTSKEQGRSRERQAQQCRVDDVFLGSGSAGRTRSRPSGSRNGLWQRRVTRMRFGPIFRPSGALGSLQGLHGIRLRHGGLDIRTSILMGS